MLLSVVLLLYSCASVDAGFTTTNISPRPIWNSTYTDKLRKDLLLNYDKFARPTQHYNVTTVKFGLSVLHIEVNEFKSTFTAYSILQLAWNDEKLKWNPSDYGGIEKLHLAEHEVWQPDISLFNSATTIAISHYTNTHFVAFARGEVFWSPPAQFTVFCDFDFRHWPFDVQRCHLQFMSWTYHGDQIDLTFMDNVIMLDLLINNTEWLIDEVYYRKIDKECCKAPIPYLIVDFTITRSSPLYKTIIVAPAVVVVLLTTASFWLPPQAGQKITVNVAMALITCLCMLYFTQKLPAMGTHTPFIVLFYSSCLYMVTFSTITSVVVLTLSTTTHTNGIPWVIKQLLTGTAGKLLVLGPYVRKSSIAHKITEEEMRDHQVTDFEDLTNCDERHIIGSTRSTKPTYQEDWMLLAVAIDRVTFVCYCLLFAIISMAYAV